MSKIIDDINIQQHIDTTCDGCGCYVSRPGKCLYCEGLLEEPERQPKQEIVDG